jgi:hypothetical protein
MEVGRAIAILASYGEGDGLLRCAVCFAMDEGRLGVTRYRSRSNKCHSEGEEEVKG